MHGPKNDGVPEGGTGQVGRTASRAASRVRALANGVTLVGAITFVALLVASRINDHLMWYAARAGLITIFAFIVSFIAILVENRQTKPPEGDSESW